MGLHTLLFATRKEGSVERAVGKSMYIDITWGSQSLTVLNYTFTVIIYHVDDKGLGIYL